MKKFQHVHITILSLLFIGLLFSAYLVLSSFRTMLDAKKENISVVSSVSVLKQNKTPYSPVEYQNILNLFSKNYVSPNVTVDIKNSFISITSSNIENELEVRQAMLSLLALDKNLVIESMCGKTNNSCNGFALEIIIKGEKTNTILTTEPVNTIVPPIVK